MGSVWLAEDTKLDGFKVAIKMLPSVLLSNERAYRQIKSEALLSLKLIHSNIAPIRSFEENNGNPFLVEDYIRGKNLDACLAEWGTLSEEETIALLKPVAEAIDYAHSAKVVHRDIKPANIMIREDGTPFVLDFGIAREMQETMTKVTGKLSSGTLMYMSPEQLKGAAPAPSQDVYSFAAMAYECLCGHPPFHRGQIEYQIVNETPEPLPFDSALSRKIMSALSKSPDERPDSCFSVLDVALSTEKKDWADTKTTANAADSTVTKQSMVRKLSRKPFIRTVAFLIVLLVIALFQGGSITQQWIFALFEKTGAACQQKMRASQAEWTPQDGARVDLEKAAREHEERVKIALEQKKQNTNKAIRAFESGDWKNGKDLSYAADRESNPQIQLYLGMCWDTEENTPGCAEKDDGNAAIWYEKAFNAGEMNAGRRLWKMFWSGRGVACDPKKAQELVEKCAKSGDAICQYEYAGFLENLAECVRRETIKNLVSVLAEETDIAEEARRKEVAAALLDCSVEQFEHKVSKLPEDAKAKLGSLRDVAWQGKQTYWQMAMEWYKKAAQKGLKKAGVALEQLRMRYESDEQSHKLISKMSSGGVGNAKDAQVAENTEDVTVSKQNAEGKEGSVGCKFCGGKGEVVKTVSCPKEASSICFNCDGKGRLKCDQCEGRGETTGTTSRGRVKTKCWRCKGNGYEVCDICKGVGTYTGKCTRCNGTGTVRRKCKCEHCGGKGKVLSDGEIRKLLNAGYKPSPQLSGDELQNFVRIKDAFESVWDKPAWSEDLHPMTIRVWFGENGNVVDYKLESSSGNQKADNSIILAAKRVRVVSGLGKSFIDRYKTSGIPIRFTVKPN